MGDGRCRAATVETIQSNGRSKLETRLRNVQEFEGERRVRFETSSLWAGSSSLVLVCAPRRPHRHQPLDHTRPSHIRGGKKSRASAAQGSWLTWVTRRTDPRVLGGPWPDAQASPMDTLRYLSRVVWLGGRLGGGLGGRGREPVGTLGPLFVAGFPQISLVIIVLYGGVALGRSARQRCGDGMLVAWSALLFP